MSDEKALEGLLDDAVRNSVGGAMESCAPKHTPGPWVLGHGNGSIIKAGRGANAFVVAEATPPTTRNNLSSEEVQANADLIAAAPEMYEALRWLVDYDLSPGKNYSLADVIAKAGAALRKAGVE